MSLLSSFYVHLLCTLQLSGITYYNVQQLNVMSYVGVYYPMADLTRLPIIVMEKMYKSLRDWIEECNKIVIPVNVKLSILDDVCLGLRYLHSKDPPILHRDLTPNNILLTSYLEAKISDLGVAKAVQTKSLQSMTKAPGTAIFMPPEALADEPIYGLPLDVFSLGGVILFTTIQQWPQPASWIQIDSDTGNKMYLSEVQRRQHYLDKMTGDVVELIVKPLIISCLSDNPKDRPSVKQVYTKIMAAKRASIENSNSCCGELNRVKWWVKVSGEQEFPSLNVELQQQQVSYSIACIW